MRTRGFPCRVRAGQDAEEGDLDGETILAILVVASPAILIVGLSVWTDVSNKRPGGIPDHHLREIRKLHAELGTSPVEDPATLSWTEGVNELSRLQNALRRRDDPDGLSGPGSS